MHFARSRWPQLPLLGQGRWGRWRPSAALVASQSTLASTVRPPPPAPPPAPVALFPGAPQLRAKPEAMAGAGYPLTEQLRVLDEMLLPTPEQFALRDWIQGTLKPLFEQHTGGVLHLFGSCANGFWMKTSDVDACLVIRRCSSKQAWLTKLRLVDALVRRERFGTSQVVRAARVPVAKLLDPRGIEFCDVSVNNVAALENSRFVQTLASLDPRVQALGRIIKHWASCRKINNRSEGTLSTYTLILQLFYFLQMRAVPVLPLVTSLLQVDPEIAELTSPAEAINALAPGSEMCVESGELRPPAFVTDAAAILGPSGRCPTLGQNSETIGELLVGFFHYWGDKAFRGGDEGRGQTIRVFDGAREDNDLGVLVMRCPLTGKNVNPFTISVWQAIHSEFERAATLLDGHRKVDKLEEVLEVAEASPVSRGPRS